MTISTFGSEAPALTLFIVCRTASPAPFNVILGAATQYIGLTLSVSLIYQNRHRLSIDILDELTNIFLCMRTVLVKLSFRCLDNSDEIR